jgi:hypothetical protein
MPRHAASQGQDLQGISASVSTLFSVLQDANALLIPAHLHSTPNAFRSRSIDDIYADPVFLKHAREHFTALEVTSEKTAAFFDGKHEETGRLHKTCIQSSDSHEPDKLGWRSSYIQLQEPTYGQLKTGLELPFRTSLQVPSIPSTYIIAINIKGQFLTDLWLSFSPYCNAFIGVKGSDFPARIVAVRAGSRRASVKGTSSKRTPECNPGCGRQSNRSGQADGRGQSPDRTVFC